MMSLKNITKDFPWSLLVVVLILTLMGILFIYTASYSTRGHSSHYALKQCVWFMIGLAFLFCVVVVCRLVVGHFTD